MSTVPELNASKSFSALRALIWPIYGHEHKKFLAMFFMFFLISFNFNILRTVKETLVITAQGSGAEVIPFIKVWAMFPSAVLMTFLFTWLSNRFSKERVFYIFMALFLGYFTLFLFYLFPNSDQLHLNATADWLQSHLPAGLKGFTVMLRHWTFTSFYVAAELWGNIILIMLFWGFINQITKLEEAKRFYGLLALGANISGIIAGQVSIYLSKLTVSPLFQFGHTAWEQSLFLILSLVLVFGVLTLFVFYWINKNILNNPLYYCPKTAQQEKAVKGKLSLIQSIKHLLKSPYLSYITCIVLTYNIATNLVDVLWKDQIRLLYPNANDYNLFINQVATWIGIGSSFSAIFISGNALRFLGWTKTALITPLILLVTSILFFGLLFCRQFLEYNNILIFGMTPLTIIVFIGAFQYVLYRSAKYTLFDSTKEMAFIPLSTESKIKGKAVIDGVCNRLGKSGGSMIHQGLLVVFGSFALSAPYVSGILFLILGSWLGSVHALGKAFHKLSGSTSERTIEEIDETNAQPVVLKEAT